MFRSVIRAGSVIGSGAGMQRGCLVQGSMLVVEVFVFAQGVPQVVFVPDEELLPARLHSPFHDRVYPRHADTGEHRLDVGFGEDLVHEGEELPISVSDQKACPAVGIVQVHHEMSDCLDDPCGGGVSGGAEHVDVPVGVLDDGEVVLGCRSR
jgi:hypothetical protein